MKPLLIENFDAEAAISPHRIVKYGAADLGVLHGAAATDKMCGVSDSLGADASGDRVDIVTHGVTDVEYGGAVTRGDWLTSDANGKAVAAAPAAGVNNNVIGQARVSGVDGDIGKVRLVPHQIQGA